MKVRAGSKEGLVVEFFYGWLILRWQGQLIKLPAYQVEYCEVVLGRKETNDLTDIKVPVAALKVQ